MKSWGMKSDLSYLFAVLLRHDAISMADEGSIIPWRTCISPYLQACSAKEGSLFSDVTGKHIFLHEY